MKVDSQLVLNLNHRVAQGRNDFLVSKSNEDAVHWIDLWPNWPTMSSGLNVFGPTGSGKTHLGVVWQTQAKAIHFDRHKIAGGILERLLEERCHVVLDGLTSEWPGDLVLHIYNLVAEKNGNILVLSRLPAAQLDCEPSDLSSRLSTLSAVEIRAPDDVLLIGIMQKLFSDRQLVVGYDVLSYLNSRMVRSFEEAIRWVDILDSMSLSEGKSITMPLVRRAMVGAYKTD